MQKWFNFQLNSLQEIIFRIVCLFVKNNYVKMDTQLLVYGSLFHSSKSR